MSLMGNGLKIQQDRYKNMCKKLNTPVIKYFFNNIFSERMDLRHRGIGDRGFRVIARLLRDNIVVTELNISDNNLTAKGGQFIAKLLLLNCFLAWLDLSVNRIHDQGAILILLSLETNVNVEYLNISQNQLTGCSFESLARLLSVNKKLKELILSKNCFSTSLGQSMDNALRSNNTLEVLDFSWNQLFDQSIIVISTALEWNNKLKKLNLSWNSFQDNAAVALGKALAINLTLTELDLSHNRISIDGARGLAQGLRINETLKVLHLQGNNNEPHSIQALLDACAENVDSVLTEINFEQAWFSEQNEKTLKEILSYKKDFIALHEGCIRNIEKLNEELIHREIFTAMKHYIQRNRLRAVDVFSQWDVNQDALITHDEFIRSLYQFIPVRMHKFKIDLVVSWLDPKDSGVINYRDFLQIVRDYQTKVPRYKQSKPYKPCDHG